MGLSILGAADEGVKRYDLSAPRGVFTHFPFHDIYLTRTDLGPTELTILLTPFDLKRLESYANNMIDYHVILDLIPCIATLYFDKRLGDEVKLSAVQSSILLALGLQRKTIEEAEVCYNVLFYTDLSNGVPYFTFID